MKKITTIIILLSYVLVLKSQPSSLVWAKGFGGTLADVGTSIITDANGNVYTAGYFNGLVDFDPTSGTYTLSSNGGIDFYISKLDAAGNFIWAKSIGGTSNDFAYGITTDASGNVIVTGSFGGAVDFDPNSGVTNLTSNSAIGIFVLKLDALGNFIWAKAMYGNSYAYGQSVEVDVSGNVYTVGQFSGVIDFDPGLAVSNLTVVGSSDIFVSKLDAAGNLVWIKSMGGSGLDSGNDIKIDGAGNIYTVGYFNNTVDFDPGPGTFTLTSVGAYDVYVSKWNTSGNFLWTAAFGGTANDNGTAIDVDALGNVYASGSYNGTVDFDPGVATYTLVSTGNSDCFISKLDGSGNFIWAKSIGDVNSDLATSLILDASNNIYASGQFKGTVDFDPSQNSYTLASTTSNNADAFVTKFDAIGIFVWAVAIGGSGNDNSNALSIDPLNNIYSTGQFFSTSDFDPNPTTYTLSSNGNSDVFIHKMGQCIAPSSPTNITSTTNLTVCIGNTASLLVASTATVNWYSSLNGTISIATGTNYVTPVLGAGTYTYFAEALTCTTSVLRTAISFSVIGCVTGLNNVVERSDFIKIYPNPTSNFLNFEIQISEKTNFKVINALGEIVMEEQITSNNKKIDVSHLNAGIYNLIINNEDQQKSNKFIKE